MWKAKGSLDSYLPCQSAGEGVSQVAGLPLFVEPSRLGDCLQGDFGGRRADAFERIENALPDAPHLLHRLPKCVPVRHLTPRSDCHRLDKLPDARCHVEPLLEHGNRSPQPVAASLCLQARLETVAVSLPGHLDILTVAERHADSIFRIPSIR